MKEEFKQWILNQTFSGIEISEEEVDKLVLKSKHALGKVNFYPMDIIELSVDNLYNNEPAFYLHFQLNLLEHAKELFLELIECMHSIKNTNQRQILFCCSSGLTTSYFASMINSINELLNNKYQIDAISYDSILKVIDLYELVCLAPQVAYKLDELKQIKPHANIIKIPPQIFAQYDAKSMIRLIEEKIETNQDKKIQAPDSYRHIQGHDDPILCLNIIRNSRRTHIIYAVYDAHNFVLMDDHVIKPVISLSDLYDAIELSLARYPNICCIGMSLPGIINKERFISANYVEGLNDHHLDNLFTNKYHKPFIFTNDANAAAVGFYSIQNKYESLSFIYQPLYYRAGIGSIVNGKLLVGAHHLSGEVKLLPMELTKPFRELIQEKEGAIEIVTKEIIALITTIDPEAIVICSQLMNDIQPIEDELLKYLQHKEYLPDLILEENFHMYIFLGQLILCIESLQERKSV